MTSSVVIVVMIVVVGGGVVVAEPHVNVARRGAAKTSARRSGEPGTSAELNRTVATPSTVRAPSTRVYPPGRAVPSPNAPTRETLFTTPAMTDYVATREGVITAAVYDVENHETYLYRPGVEQQTASIVKVDILETLLYDEQQDGATIDADDAAVAAGMIEESDNADAEDLWEEDGAAPGVTKYDDMVGLTETTPNFHWGETTTTALDQVDLLKLLVFPNRYLDDASRAYEVGLMENVTSWEDWGVSSGPDGRCTVALKNGWLPLSGDDWQINSIGYVNGEGRDYVIAVLTTQDPTESYGIDSIEGLSKIAWQELAPGPVAARSVEAWVPEKAA